MLRVIVARRESRDSLACWCNMSPGEPTVKEQLMAKGGLHGGSKGSSGHRASGGSRAHSAHAKSFVSGKIAGQYRAKGYSKAHASYIGNRVVGKMGSTFASGKGSKRSYASGYAAGYRQVGLGSSKASRACGPKTHLKKSERCKKASSYSGSGHPGGQSGAGFDETSPAKLYGKAYGKSYSKDYSKRYR